MAEPTVLLVDDNRDLLHFLERLMANDGWTLLTAESATEAKSLVQSRKPDAVLLDYMLPDGNGVELGIEFRQSVPQMLVIVMAGTIIPPEEEALCEEHNFAVLRKPFLASDVMKQIRLRLRPPGPSIPETEPEIDSKALKVVFSYSHKDAVWRDRLDAHLSTLRRMGLIHSWHDRKIIAGEDFNTSIDRQLKTADLILLLISPDFLNSDYCYRIEMREALARHGRGECRVIPVILRPVDWEKAPFASLLAVPRDGKPVTLWQNKDQALMDAAKSIRVAAEELSATLKR
jgi:DNA-binding response OmpR family regulator